MIDHLTLNLTHNHNNLSHEDMIKLMMMRIGRGELSNEKSEGEEGGRD